MSTINGKLHLSAGQLLLWSMFKFLTKTCELSSTILIKRGKDNPKPQDNSGNLEKSQIELFINGPQLDDPHVLSSE